MLNIEHYIKSVFCVDLTGFVCVAFQHNYANARRSFVSDKNVVQSLLSGDIKHIMRIFAAIRCINSDKRMCVWPCGQTLRAFTPDFNYLVFAAVGVPITRFFLRFEYFGNIITNFRKAPPL